MYVNDRLTICIVNVFCTLNLSNENILQKQIYIYVRYTCYKAQLQ